MDADNKPTCVEVRPVDTLTLQTHGKEERIMKTDVKMPPLPIALREHEITEQDVTVMLRVARDKKAETGRYKRTPKRVPSAQSVSVTAQR